MNEENMRHNSNNDMGENKKDNNEEKEDAAEEINRFELEATKLLSRIVSAVPGCEQDTPFKDDAEETPTEPFASKEAQAPSLPTPRISLPPRTFNSTREMIKEEDEAVRYIDLSQEQKDIVSCILESGGSDRPIPGNHFITGEAGTGKSVLLKECVRACYRRDGVWPLVAGTTGIAAFAVQGVTVHRVFGITRKGGFDLSAKNMEKIRNARVLIVDEISMLTKDALRIVDSALRSTRACPDVPFGGIQVVYFGDFLQLPPVDPGYGRNEAPFCFESDIWAKAGFQVHVLKCPFRQQDDEKFHAMLWRARVGEHTEQDIEDMMRNARERPIPPDAVILRPTREEVLTINNAALASLEGETHTYCARRYGSCSNRRMDIPAEEVLKLRKGTPVILVVNISVWDGLVNGARGIVIGFAKEMGNIPIVRFDESGIETRVDFFEWKSRDDGESCEQIPLIQAWAMTIHKSQGMTLKRVFIDLTRIFESGQAYVALSRARKLESLYVTGAEMSKIRANPRAIAFYATFDDRYVAAAKANAEREAVAQNIDLLISKRRNDFDKRKTGATSSFTRLPGKTKSEAITPPTQSLFVLKRKLTFLSDDIHGFASGSAIAPVNKKLKPTAKASFPLHTFTQNTDKIDAVNPASRNTIAIEKVPRSEAKVIPFGKGKEEDNALPAAISTPRNTKSAFLKRRREKKTDSGSSSSSLSSRKALEDSLKNGMEVREERIFSMQE